MGLAELLTPLSKGWCTDLGVELASTAVQVHGGMGFIEETGVGQYYRDARILPIYEGTNGIQALDLVGRKLSLQGGAPVKALFGEMDATVKALAATGDEMAAMSLQLNLAVSALKEVGGYLLAKSALKAREMRTVGDADTTFLDAKIVTARFFMAQILPMATALLGPVTEGAETLFAIDDAQLSA